MRNDITFSSHALSQFSKRLCIPMVEAVSVMRGLWNKSQEITRERAYEITLDREILKKKNKDTKYYSVDLSDGEVISKFKSIGYGIPKNITLGIFVVRHNNCVTFKTDLDMDIWSNLYKFKNNRRYFDLAY